MRWEGGRVVAVGRPRRGERWDAEIDGVVVPGLIDLQVNGAGPHDVLAGSPDAVRGVARALLGHGVVAWLPTIVTAPEPDRLAALDAVADVARGAMGGARILGVHLEGPWLSPLRAGAHPLDALTRPDEGAIATSLGRHPGLVKLVTLAPELGGGLDAIAQITGTGAIVSLGHSDASAREVRAAVDAGAKMATHLWNAMRPFHHRAPGIAGAVLADQRITAGLIADGVHVDPDALLLAFRAKTAARIALVSDMVAARSPQRSDVSAALLPDGTLAGAYTGLGDAIRVLVDAGVPLADAVQAATLVPAGLLGVRIGRLEPGTPADFVVLDDALRVVTTYVGGVEVWSR